MSTAPQGPVTPQGVFSAQAANSLLAGPATVITANGAIYPHSPAKYVITKATAALLTLAAPAVGTDDGVLLEFLSTTAAAHTITTPAAGDIQDGNSGGNQTVMTFNAKKGVLCILEAYQGVWYVRSEIGCSLTS